jgi:hypothetical protein
MWRSIFIAAFVLLAGHASAQEPVPIARLSVAHNADLGAELAAYAQMAGDRMAPGRGMSQRRMMGRRGMMGGQGMMGRRGMTGGRGMMGRRGMRGGRGMMGRRGMMRQRGIATGSGVDQRRSACREEAKRIHRPSRGAGDLNRDFIRQAVRSCMQRGAG